MQENILVVDDNDDIRSNVAEYLRAKGWKAEEASTGPMAVAQVHTGAFDLVLLDLGLPGMDGIEVCRKLRSEGYSLPIMMLTRAMNSMTVWQVFRAARTIISSSLFHSGSFQPVLKQSSDAARGKWLRI